ncbi:hypothetical protein Tco_1468829, partial [Tanacetum coccineum]
EIPLESQEIPFTSINVSLLLESQLITNSRQRITTYSGDGGNVFGDGGDVRVRMMVVMFSEYDDGGDVRVPSMMMVALCSDDDGDVFR